MANDPIIPIRFVDMAQRDKEERGRLKAEKFSIEVRRDENKDKLPPDLADRLKDIERLLNQRVVDPIYIRVRDLLAGLTRTKVTDPSEGLYPTQSKKDTIENLNEGELTLVAVYGLITADNVTNPASDRFARAVAAALGELTNSRDLFGRTFMVIAGESLTRRGEQVEIHVRSDKWAQVVRALRDAGVTADDPNLPLQTRRALEDSLGIDDGAPPSSIAINLPDLELQADLEIVVDNLNAAQVFYFSAMLEEMRLWQVVEKLVELFQFGMLPIGRGNAGNRLYRYWKSSANRISELERRNMYARVFGMPGGEVSQGTDNRDFPDLWLRFVSAVYTLIRQQTVDNMLRANIPVNISQEQVRKAGRDLAANLSLHAYGIAYFAATEIQTTINEFIELLSEPEIRAAYGARDMYQVIDQVNSLELEGPRNTVRYRTMAQAGAVIIRWLGKRADRLSGGGLGPVIDLSEVRTPSVTTGHRPTSDPTDFDLVTACEQWLAVTGTQDNSVEQYSQSIESPNMTSAPIRIPNIARDMLASVGVQAGVRSKGYGNGNGNGRGYGRY
jgi:hypothetical protein